MIKQCKYCGKEYVLKYKGQYYCNKECQKSNLPNMECINCGKIFSFERYRIKIVKFCSRKCKHEYRDNNIKYICKKCGREKVFISKRWRCRPCDNEYKKISNIKNRVSRVNNKKFPLNKKYCYRCHSIITNIRKNICDKCIKICRKCGKEKVLFSNRLRCINCDKKCREINKERILEKLRVYRKKNLEIVRFWSRNRQNKKRNSLGDHTFIEWNELKRKYNYTCLCCGKSEPEIKLTEDHIVPLSKGGSNYIDNIQPLCQVCNSTKNNKTIDFRNRQEE